MFQTKNDLPEKTRRDCIALLQQRLADGIDLMHQAKQAHWNVKGANFIALHELFDKIHEEIEGLTSKTRKSGWPWNLCQRPRCG